jgi:hypothetical protein
VWIHLIELVFSAFDVLYLWKLQEQVLPAEITGPVEGSEYQVFFGLSVRSLT